jgi:hypothetical protein
MRNWILITALFAALPAWSEEPQLEILVDGSVYAPEEFQVPGAKVEAMPTYRPSREAIPDKEVREEAFAKVEGLAKEIARFDELSRDLLYVRARNRSLKELRKAYPAIPAPVLSRLHKQLRGS